MTIADWMMAHPWMTLIICLAFAAAISDLGPIRRRKND